MTALVSASSWDNQSQLYSVKRNYIKSVSVSRPSENISSYTATVETYEQICEPRSMLYDVDISFLRGTQKVVHSLSDARLLPGPADLFDEEDDGSPRFQLTVPREAEALLEWHEKILTVVSSSCEWALLDALGTALDAKHYEGWNSPASGSPPCIEPRDSENAIINGSCDLPTYFNGSSGRLFYFAIRSAELTNLQDHWRGLSLTQLGSIVRSIDFGRSLITTHVTL